MRRREHRLNTPSRGIPHAVKFHQAQPGDKDDRRTRETSVTLEEQRAQILTGRMHNDLTSELIAARPGAVMLTNAYNDGFGAPQADREALLRDLLDRVGPGAHFEP